ncbi:MurR/RpiR family transcriptional regulator [Inquilinus sp. CAU 1745]|uniref:MurR/RpiR family transcriptional regulator n=1 Tax=Inquilinus sp. CAU 1745 TaxID=3140369 RepID=UPI00325B3198
MPEDRQPSPPRAEGPDALRQALLARYEDLSPQAQKLAGFVLENPDEVAFLSVRRLAHVAGVNPSAVIRLAQAAGFDSFEAFREVFRAALQARKVHYGTRAAALQREARQGSQGGEQGTFQTVARSAIANIEAFFQPEMAVSLERIAKGIVTAPAVHVVGVRSSRSLAVYFAYVGRIAFPHIRLVPTAESMLIDELALGAPGDMLMVFTFEPYSAEMVRAARLAQGAGMRIVAVTDRPTSPIARDAWGVLSIPMESPHYLPSLVACQAVCEALLATMVSLSGRPAIDNVTSFEDRVRRVGGYVE